MENKNGSKGFPRQIIFCLVAMGQSESRNSREVHYGPGHINYYDGGNQPYSSRYEVKKDTYEFWNTVDKRVPNAMGSRLSDYEVVRPTSASYAYRPYDSTEVTNLYGSRPISTTVVQEPYYYPNVQTVPVTQQSYSTPYPVVQSSGNYTSTYPPYTVSNPTYATAPYVSARVW